MPLPLPMSRTFRTTRTNSRVHVQRSARMHPLRSRSVLSPPETLNLAIFDRDHSSTPRYSAAAMQNRKPHSPYGLPEAGWAKPAIAAHPCGPFIVQKGEGVCAVSATFRAAHRSVHPLVLVRRAASLR